MVVRSGGDRTKIMYYVYVIKSRFFNFYYKGFCSNLEKRILEHNNKMTKSNKHYAPFDLVYFEECSSLQEAIKKEKYWKTASGRKYLKNKIS